MVRQRHKGSSKNGGRERLIATARELFTQRGASNVGINDVTDRANVARMTLYNNFESKDALVFAVYEDMIQGVLAELDRIDDSNASEEDRVSTLFEHVEINVNGGPFRGCPFVHASLQDAEPLGPVYNLVHSYKLALREHIFGMLNERRGNRNDLADQLLLLLDGATTEGYLKGVANPGKAALKAAIVLLQA